jgi:hypothetical protein
MVLIIDHLVLMCLGFTDVALSVNSFKSDDSIMLGIWIF